MSDLMRGDSSEQSRLIHSKVAMRASDAVKKDVGILARPVFGKKSVPVDRVSR